MPQVGFWAYPVKFARLDQAVHHRTPVTSVIITEEELVFPQADRTQGSFGGVIVYLCQSIFTEVSQRFFAVQKIPERCGQSVFSRGICHLFFHRVIQRQQKGFASALPYPESLRLRKTAYFFLYGILLTDTRQCLFAVSDVRVGSHTSLIPLRVCAIQAASVNGPPLRSSLNNLS